MKKEIEKFLIENKKRIINFIIQIQRDNFRLYGVSDFEKQIFVLEEDFSLSCFYGSYNTNLPLQVMFIIGETYYAGIDLDFYYVKMYLSKNSLERLYEYILNHEYIKEYEQELIELESYTNEDIVKLRNKESYIMDCYEFLTGEKDVYVLEEVEGLYEELESNAFMDAEDEIISCAHDIYNNGLEQLF